MIVVADSGSTKTSWRFFDETKKMAIETIGFNPYFVSTAEIVSTMKIQLSGVDCDSVHAVYFYGAGCNEEKKPVVAEALISLFPNATIEVCSDMLGAARATLQHSEGLVGILGTGSNVCLYNGTTITCGAVSLGWILGDEGGGVYLGKLLLKAYLSKSMPSDLADKLNSRFKFKNADIIENIYRKPFPNRFVAGFSHFLLDHLSDEFVQSILNKNFSDYFDTLVSQIPNYTTYKKTCVGSVAHYFSSNLIAVANEKGVEVDLIIQNPIDGLVKYHSLNP